MKIKGVLGCFLALILVSCSVLAAADTVLPIILDKEGSTGGLELVVHTGWLQENEPIHHQLLVYDYSLTQRANASVQKWRDELTALSSPDGYRIMGVVTEIDHHDPYGVLETTIEVLKMQEENTEYDWYDVTVSQTLTPGANYTSDWEWNWLTYTMNGTYGKGNIMLSDYDPPPSHEAPTGIFTFLWRLLGFDLSNYLPWIGRPEPVLEGVDMSDFSLEVYRVRYSAEREYSHRDEPLEIRHHYVARVVDGGEPVFWHQTQVQYTQAEDYAQIPVITPPLATGYIKVR
ncbi:MAG: hypothetical protein NWF07_01710 [Candidatus Bathyarchaeota archaeon]|nr:hypothetical protein [Candidatus Bathyarchaeota archaeon]